MDSGIILHYIFILFGCFISFKFFDLLDIYVSDAKGKLYLSMLYLLTAIYEVIAVSWK